MSRPLPTRGTAESPTFRALFSRLDLSSPILRTRAHAFLQRLEEEQAARIEALEAKLAAL